MIIQFKIYSVKTPAGHSSVLLKSAVIPREAKEEHCNLKETSCVSRELIMVRKNVTFVKPPCFILEQGLFLFI